MSSDMEQKAQGRNEGGISENARLCAEHDRLAAELAAARVALNPFAVAAGYATTPGTVSPEMVVLWCQQSSSQGPMGAITVADCRKAAAVLSSPSAASDVEEVLAAASSLVALFTLGWVDIDDFPTGIKETVAKSIETVKRWKGV